MNVLTAALVSLLTLSRLLGLPSPCTSSPVGSQQAPCVAAAFLSGEEDDKDDDEEDEEEFQGVARSAA